MYPLKSSNLFNFRDRHQKGRGAPTGGAVGILSAGGGAQTGNVTPLPPEDGN